MSLDPSRSSVVFLLSADGAERQTAFTDLTGKAITTYGNARISAADKKYGPSSAYFDGEGSYLSLPNSADFDFGSGDFTVELWVNISAASVGVYSGLVTSGYQGYAPWLIYYSGVDIVFYSSADGATWGISSGVTIQSAPTAGAWYHIAVSRSGSSIRLFSNGALANTITFAGSLMSLGANVPHIARWNNNTLTGFVDDVRVTKGVGRYTAAFTPPTALADDYLVGFSSTVLSTPLVNAVNLSFVGSAEYTPVAKTGIELNLQSGNFATGVTSTAFGTGKVELTLPATGAVFAQDFGLPVGVKIQVAASAGPFTQIPLAYYAFTQTQTATGASTTSFGSAATHTAFTGVATSLGETVGAGSPIGWEHWNVSGLHAETQFGMVYYPYLQTAVASGFVGTRIGLGLGLKGQQSATHAYCGAEGFRSTQIGAPTTPTNRTGTARGIISSRFGLPRTTALEADGFTATRVGTPAVAAFSQTLTAAGTALTQVGTPVARVAGAATTCGAVTVLGVPRLTSITAASGARSTAFGTATVHRSNVVSSITRHVRFGTPRAFKTLDFRVYPFARRTAFGRPKYIVWHPTTTGACSTQLGTPYSGIGHPALHVPPNTYFGNPLLVRTPLC